MVVCNGYEYFGLADAYYGVLYGAFWVGASSMESGEIQTSVLRRQWPRPPLYLLGCHGETDLSRASMVSCSTGKPYLCNILACGGMLVSSHVAQENFKSLQRQRSISFCKRRGKQLQALHFIYVRNATEKLQLVLMWILSLLPRLYPLQLYEFSHNLTCIVHFISV